MQSTAQQVFGLTIAHLSAAYALGTELPANLASLNRLAHLGAETHSH